MKRILLGAWLLTGVAACDEPTRPAVPTIEPRGAVAAAEQEFRVRFLSTEFFAIASELNEAGEVVGGFLPPPGTLGRAFLWRAGQGMRDLGTLGGFRSQAQGINDRGEVVGTSETRSVPGSERPRAFIWSEDRGMRSLGTLGGNFSEAQAINNRREVVGVSENSNGRFRAFLWRPGQGMRSLGSLGGPNSVAFDVNDATQVVGTSQITPSTEHAFLWTADGGMEDLGTLGGANSGAFGISETGAVVGFSQIADGSFRGFLWTREGGMRRLPVGAVAVNTHLRVAGDRLTAAGQQIPVVWTPEDGVQRLPRRGAIDFGFASDLNEFGQIVGSLSPAGSGLIFAALWTPTAGPLATEAPDEGAMPEVAVSPGEYRDAVAALCALGRELREWSRYGVARACQAL